MQLKHYIPNVDKKYRDIFFSGISFDSSKVRKNYIFFAIEGNKVDGNNYINDAIKNGAKIIVSKKRITKKKNDIVFLYSSNVRKSLAEVSYKILHTRLEKIVAVTGTNGKSSIADFYYQILNLNFKKVASIGTIGVKYKGKNKPLKNTTLDPIQLSSIIQNLGKKKIEYLIMEASSHGLKQNRLDGLLFDIGIFSNLSHDHLDYHKNMKNYLNSKLYLFEKLIKKKGDIITDAKIPQSKNIKKISIKKNINLSLIFTKKKGIELISHKFENEKQVIEIRFQNRKYNFDLNLIGKIQLKNVLMAIIAANKSGVEIKKIINIIDKLKPVEGRLEKIGEIKNNSKVILDYAHTPEALRSVLLNLKEQFPLSKIKLLFGCGGNRDFEKRSIMGKIADKFSNRIYLTDDNPRNESPSKIRSNIKRGIKKVKIEELPNRKKAIHEAIMTLKTGDVLLVAGKGHEKFQDYGNRKLFFSDKEIILKSISQKNKSLSKNLKLNIIKEQSNSKISNKLIIKNISINSKNLKKGDAFFAIKGKKIDANKFASEAFKKKASLVIVNKINKNLSLSKQIKVKNTLNFLTKCSSIFRQNISTKIISITGSSGKTTLKEMLGFILKNISRTSYSPRSYNNKYGVPLSLINLKRNDKFGVIEVGMDKKGEIDNLTKIIKPDLGIITNISYAHSKNFKNIRQIAKAKAEIMNNIKQNGTIILNKDDNFYDFHKKIAIKKKLNVISYGVKNKSAMIKITKINKIKNIYELYINIGNQLFSFYVKNNFESNLYNTLATLAAVSLYSDVKILKKDIFLKFKTPIGRGDISKIKFKNKNIFFIDESYNSNPLSLKIAVENYDKIATQNSKRYLILGDMLELGKNSLKQHRIISKIINKSKIDQVYVIGKYIRKTFQDLDQSKKAQILTSKKLIIDLINNNLNNNDYLMIKGSNSTGLHQISNNLKQKETYAI